MNARNTIMSVLDQCGPMTNAELAAMLYFLGVFGLTPKVTQRWYVDHSASVQFSINDCRKMDNWIVCGESDYNNLTTYRVTEWAHNNVLPVIKNVTVPWILQHCTGKPLVLAACRHYALMHE